MAENQSPRHQGRSEDRVRDMVTTVSSTTPSLPFWCGIVLGALLGIATIALIIQNGATVALQWFTLDFAAPLWLFLLASAISGAILALLARPLLGRMRKNARERRQAARQLRKITR